MAGLANGLLGDDDAFSGLMSLIPTRMHYGDEDDGQTSKKKAKKNKGKQAKQANPDTGVTKTDTDGNKRKLEDGDGDVAEKERAAPTPKKKKVKVDSPTDEVKAEEQLITEANEEAEKTGKAPIAQPASAEDGVPETVESATPVSAKKKNKKEKKAERKAETPATPVVEEKAAKTPAKSTTPKVETPSAKLPTKAAIAPTPAVVIPSDLSEASSEPQSPTFDEPTQKLNVPADTASSTTSVSSVVTPFEKPKHIKIPEDTTAFRERFAERLAALRASRKADGPDGKPVRTRQELLEQRRYKASQRKEHKKEVRRLAKLAEDEKREEALKANSPSVMSPGDELDENTANFSFGRVSFGDGAQLSHDLSYVLSNKPKKGPSDPKTALTKLQNQKKRLAAMDEDKRRDVEEKEAWLTARRRAEGERVRDDETILKKSLKRKERGKKKSEKEWQERKNAVAAGIKARQKKRNDNLRKRIEEKGTTKARQKKTGAKKKSRPGFEGKFGGKK
ncbi:related to RRP14 - involved in ribosomal RNA processing [Cephalotrichum gorgonifer]|uniref:Related to RRP14 - involved in ribosomal RNA processing n=1 Tax=Cephalotrichum gorgonifer TaxID=2041049 RepID=A0AAE8SU60_9PEZI|nr:related to RRP14 - involved in ribosomal RNA processing [Cephalotrichum gorgonifer]